jgi:hypothetical protein
MAETRRFVYCDGWVYGPPRSLDPRVAGEEVWMGYAARSEDVPAGWVRLFAMLNEGQFAEGQDVAFTIHRDAEDEHEPTSDDPYDQLEKRLMELVNRKMQATLLPIIDRLAALEHRVAALEETGRETSLERGHP